MIKYKQQGIQDRIEAARCSGLDRSSNIFKIGYEPQGIQHRNISSKVFRIGWMQQDIQDRIETARFSGQGYN
jgi:hypothetical protein